MKTRKPFAVEYKPKHKFIMGDASARKDEESSKSAFWSSPAKIKPAQVVKPRIRDIAYQDSWRPER